MRGAADWCLHRTAVSSLLYNCILRGHTKCSFRKWRMWMFSLLFSPSIHLKITHYIYVLYREIINTSESIRTAYPPLLYQTPPLCYLSQVLPFACLVFLFGCSPTVPFLRPSKQLSYRYRHGMAAGRAVRQRLSQCAWAPDNPSVSHPYQDGRRRIHA